MSRSTNRLRPLVEAEIRLALDAEAHGHFDTALRHLENAHVLGQRDTALHLRVHCQMWRMARRNGWAREARGQRWRMVAAALATPLGLLPAGNPGTTRVGGFRSMPVPAALQRRLDAAR